VKNICLKDRNFFKKPIMVYSYNQGSFSRINVIKNLLKDIFLKETSSYKAPLKKLGIIATYLNKLFLEEMKNLGTEGFIAVMNSIPFKNAVKLNKCVFMESSLIKGHFTSFVTRIKTINLRNKLGKRFQKNMIVPTNLINVSSLIRKTTANFIHSQDSLVLITVVIDLHELGILVHVVHDAFYVEKKHVETLKRVYYNAFIKQILSKNSVKNFFILNEVDIEIPLIKSYLQEIEEYKNILLKGISLGELKMSRFILE
jgi:hypothetical protein